MAVLLLLLVAVSRSSAQGPEVQVALAGKKVLITDGRESFVDADKAKPGDLIQYEATYRNAGKGTAKSVGATVPIPQGMAFVSESAKPSDAQASVDGKNFSALPLLREVKNAAGVVEQQPVPLTQYRAVRWLLPELPPGQSATVSVRARVLTSAAE